MQFCMMQRKLPYGGAFSCLPSATRYWAKWILPGCEYSPRSGEVHTQQSNIAVSESCPRE
jgi:hypothetical protein